MNIQNAFNAYGAQNQILPTVPNTDDALLKSDRSATTTSTSPFSAIEASFDAFAETMDSALTSEIYSKKGELDAAQKEQEESNKSEAEKDNERLNDAANRVTAEDMETLINEGYDVFGMTTEELEAAVDRMKLQKEMFDKAVEGQIEDKIAQKEAIIAMAIKTLSGNPNAERIAEKLIKAKLPVTEANLYKMAQALEMGNNEKRVSSAEAEYLIRNKLTPTLENIAEARYASSAPKKEKVLTEEAWSQLSGAVSHMLFQAGLRQSREMITAAQDFIKKDIPLTSENLKIYSQITKIKLTDDEILTRAVDAITVGQDPKSANLLSNDAKQVRQIIENNNEVTDDAVLYAAAKKAAQTGKTNEKDIDLSLSELHQAQEDIRENVLVPSVLEEYNVQGVQAATIKARRQLEEIKAKMTFESGYRLAKEGIRIDSVSMNKLISNLRALENRYYSDFFKQSGAAPGSYTQNDVDLLRDTTQRLKEIENMPATIIYDTMDRASDITLNGLYENGQDMSNRTYNLYSHTLESVMTAPSAKFGDSIEKAFSNVDSLIESTGLPTTEANRRAARILSYAHADINEDNLTKVAEYDAKLQQALTGLKPAVTVSLIREGINPLDLTLDTLNEKIGSVKDSTGLSEEDSYANFLVNVDKKGTLSQEERDAYIAIYRALHQIESSEDSALGSVFGAGAEPTLQRLLTAVRSGRVSGQDVRINDAFTPLAKTKTDVDKIENKIRAGLSRPEGSDGAFLEKICEEADSTLQELTETTEITAEDWALRLNDIAATGQNATRFLEDFNVLNTIENIEAAKDLLNNDNTIFEDFKKFKKMATGEEAVLPDFIEALDSEESISESLKAFMDEAKDIKKELQHDPILKKLDVKALKKMDTGIRFMNRLSKREFYRIPVDTGKEIVSLNVTILNRENDAEHPTKVYVTVPTENLGRVTAEASIEDNRMKCFISSDTAKGLDVLKERQLNLFAGLAQNGIQVGSIFYGTEEVSADKYDYKTNEKYKNIPEHEGTNGTPSEYYRIAKVFVSYVNLSDSQ